ncbi:MAG: hypothetical protein V2I33_01180 [Kangiellaceae bacterium]|jgi:hypothetical protein|nr:hypothetical protein [Kangiellaceae bacterium]
MKVFLTLILLIITVPVVAQNKLFLIGMPSSKLDKYFEGVDCVKDDVGILYTNDEDVISKFFLFPFTNVKYVEIYLNGCEKESRVYEVATTISSADVSNLLKYLNEIYGIYPVVEGRYRKWSIDGYNFALSKTREDIWAITVSSSVK